MDEANVGLHVSLEAVEAHASDRPLRLGMPRALGAERGELAQTLLEHLIRRDVAVATAPLCQCGPVLVRNDRLVAGEDVREDRQRYEDPELEQRNDCGRDLGRFPAALTGCALIDSASCAFNSSDFCLPMSKLLGAAATVLLNQFADAQTFTLTTSGLPSRTYTSISQARADGDNARIWGGMHYPSTVAISDTVGEAIATYVNANSMELLRDQQ
jgi:hypothetical protein